MKIEPINQWNLNRKRLRFITVVSFDITASKTGVSCYIALLGFVLRLEAGNVFEVGPYNVIET